MMGKTIGLIAAMFVAFAVPAAAQDLFPLQPHPADTAWPTEDWEIGTLEPEIETALGGLIVRALQGQKDEVMGETRAIVVIYRGKLVAEGYKDEFRADTKQVSWSMAKSVTQALVGRAVHLGLIEDIDAPMPTPFEAGDPRSAITWRQWMNMTDGLDYKEINATSLADNDVVNMMYGRGKYDVLAYARDELPLVHEPGEVWNYSSAAYHMLSSALVGATAKVETAAMLCVSEADTAYNGGTDGQKVEFQMAMKRCESQFPEQVFPSVPDNPEAVSYTRRWIGAAFTPTAIAWFNKEFFTPLGMNAQVEFDASGTFLGGSLIWASARDFAKFGYLYLRDGVWEDERLLPEGWVDFARTKTPADNANIYGAGWWITAYGEDRTHAQNAKTPPWDAFHAGGHEGQTIWVVPSRDLVIVRLGLMTNATENWEALYEWNQEIARLFPEVEG